MCRPIGIRPRAVLACLPSPATRIKDVEQLSKMSGDGRWVGVSTDGHMRGKLGLFPVWLQARERTGGVLCNLRGAIYYATTSQCPYPASPGSGSGATRAAAPDETGGSSALWPWALMDGVSPMATWFSAQVTPIKWVAAMHGVIGRRPTTAPHNHDQCYMTQTKRNTRPTLPHRAAQGVGTG